MQNSALLLDIARRHLASLGKSLHLIEGAPERDKIDLVLEGFSEDQTEADSDDSKINSPVFKVRQALDSPAHFESLYLGTGHFSFSRFWRLLWIIKLFLISHFKPKYTEQN